VLALINLLNNACFLRMFWSVSLLGRSRPAGPSLA
ncbi:hypothetical protein ACN38_g11212, partial [Penicillium nordicum]